MRHRRMTAFAADLDGKPIRSRQQGTRARSHLTYWKVGESMKPEDHIGRLAQHFPMEDAIFAHLLAAGSAFLGRLKDEENVIWPMRRLLQPSRRTDEDRSVTVMPAGVHLAGNGRGIKLARVLLDWQRVHICAEGDGRRACGVGRRGK